jgi:putative lipoic acid-binding regulatory protein
MKELTEDLNKSERLSFPVTFELKVIMDATIPDKTNIANLEMVLSSLNIPHELLRHRLSASGRYMSFSFLVTIHKHPILTGLYKELGTIPGLKFAV